MSQPYALPQTDPLLPDDSFEPLPPRAYTAQDWFDREQDLIFDRCWQFAGLVADLPEPKSYLCTKAGRHPLIVLRGEDGELRAFHNICRHRGAQLLEGQGTLQSTIVCPYHSWGYALDGRLKGVPQKQFFPGLCKDSLGLKPAACRVWNGVVFVHPDPDAEPLEDWLGGFPDRAGPHRLEELVEVLNQRYEIAANWKIYVENFLDTYHLWHLHSKSLGDYLDYSLLSWDFLGPHWVSHLPLSNPEQVDTSELPLIAGIPPSQRGVFSHLLFPNFGIVADATSWSSLHVLPVAPDRTILELRVLGDRSAAPGGLGKAVRRLYEAVTPKAETADPNDWKSGDLMQEDIVACEAIQRAIGSPAFELGPLAEHIESPIAGFQQRLLRRLSAEA